jgi:ABC-type spermidine/putrescine transport system permease subunit I
MMIKEVPIIEPLRTRLPKQFHPYVGVVFLGFAFFTPIGLLVWNSLNFQGGSLLENYRIALSGVYLNSIYYSFIVASVTTPITIILAFTISYYIVFVSSYQKILLGLVILPLWIAYIIRYLGIQLFLYPRGPVVSIFGTNFGLLFSTAGVVIGLTSGFLPFAILPIYNSLNSLDEAILDASAVMGAGSFETTYRITIPLSLSGIITAGLITFILSAGAFLAPDILGGPGNLMIANMIERSYSQIYDIELAAALAVIYTSILTIILLIFDSYINFGKVLSDI